MVGALGQTFDLDLLDVEMLDFGAVPAQESMTLRATASSLPTRR